LSILFKNCLAYELRLSIYFLCPSANIVSNARDDFPEPETPEITTNSFLGIFNDTFFRLLTLAFLIIIFLGF